MRTRPHKPIWGFGWAGWCLLGVAVALGGAWAAGVELRYMLLSAIASVFGGDAVIWFVSTVLFAHWMDFGYLDHGLGFSPLPRFGLAGMVGVLIAMHIHPHRFGLFRVGLVIVLGLWTPLLSAQLPSWIPSLTSSPLQVGYARQSALNFLLIWAITALACAGVLGWALKSRRCGVAVGAWCGIGAWLWGEAMLGLGGEPAWIVSVSGDELWWSIYGWLWSPTLCGGLFWWAIRARRRSFPDWACPGCGYDMRGLGGDRCPECGVSAAKAPPEAPRTLGA